MHNTEDRRNRRCAAALIILFVLMILLVKIRNYHPSKSSKVFLKSVRLH